MNKIYRLLPVLVYLSIIFYAGCSGNDEPKPFDCAESDLVLTLATGGDIDPTTCSSNDGSIEVEATGGKGPYKFAIGTGNFGNSSLFEDLGTGTFSVTVEDGNKCSKVLEVTLEVPGGPTGEIEKTQDTNCIAPGNGTINVAASGGSGNYQYKLDNGAFGANPLFENIASGIHTITIKDDQECTVTINTTITKGITGVDYVNDIRPIFVAKCQFAGCHPDNGDWFTYSVAKSKAEDIKALTGNGTMPKSPAPGGTLTATQIAMIACWVADGAPQN